MQHYGDIEHIVIDGASKDDTLALVRLFKHVSSVHSEPDNGIYDAMNKGIARCTGDIIGILNSDDFYPDAEVIGDVVRHFEMTGCDALYADLNYISPKKTTRIVRKWRSGNYAVNNFHFGWMPPHPTFFVRKEVYEKFGVFDTRLRSAADYELMVRFLYINQVKTEYLPRVTVHMRAGGVSNKSFRNRLKAHFEDYRAWRFNGIRPKWYTMVLKPVRKVVQHL